MWPGAWERDYEFDSESDHTDSDLTDLDTDYLEDSSSQCSEHSRLNEVFSEDSAGEYDEATRDEQPAKKRAKADKGTDAAAAEGSGRRKKTLSVIVTMPIDILLEIFGLLEPVDLLSLSLTNKAYRELLLSNNAVWKVARVNHSVPDCMPGMSEVKWATLLFRGYECHECGAKGFHRMYLGIKRRLCHACVNRNLAASFQSYIQEAQSCDPDIVDLVPFTYFGGQAYNHAKLFWLKDVQKMVKQLEVYQKDVHMSKPGAEQALEDFKQSRKKYVDSVVNHAAICDDWADKDRERQWSRARKLRDQNQKLVQARLVVIGHSDEDVERMFDHHHYGVLDEELTDTRWKRLLPTIERKLSKLKEEWRLEEQRNRKDHLLNMYERYVRPLPRAIIPPQEDFLKLCDVAEYINNPPTEDGARPFADRITGFCAEYMDSRKLALRQLLALSTDVLKDTTTLQSRGVDAPDDMFMQLATSVFQCTHLRSLPLITWDKVQYHQCPHSQGITRGYATLASTSPCTFSISQPGVAAVRSLLGLVGLDVQTTTATTMDHLQSRFFCSNCPPMPQDGGSYRMAMNWRQSVFHYVEQQDPAHAEPRWEFLSSAQLQVLQSLRTPAYPGAAAQAWRCNKCKLYHGSPDNKATVIKHVQSGHRITAPTEGIDFSYDQGMYEKPPPATKFFVIPQSEQPSKSRHKKSKSSTKPGYHCQHCNGNDSERTFVLEGVKAHIKAKHSIGSPKEGTDFCKTK
ncbi:hypothetical protein DEU56DRAFT_779431 [Suillus clintonianus]|uniref:uncharacterized protein n=1 Tax=Suillus clintonianus TaxID=1904413 RepID=UPI001B8829F3|nr:uncharacterized protein DEU56DRAFT_779431 [Suillus clintonianus]KAG2150973.1 hypothetical protein DEU56DRAFT_779431 [Suillus clintonianus]